MPKLPGREAAPVTKRAAKKAAAPSHAPGQLQVPVDDVGFAKLTDQATFHNICYYGREGSAKTTDALMMANHGKVLVINAEGGLRIKALAKRGVNLDNVMLYPNKDKGETLTFRGMQESYRQIKADLENDPQSWFGIIMDSATDVHQAILDEVSDKRVTALKNEGKDTDEWFVDRGDYGTMSKMFRHLLRRFRDLDCHFIVTALERRDVDDDTSSVTYGPAVTPGIQNDLLGYVDFVIATKAADEAKPFRGLTKRTGKYRAKDRDDVLPSIMVEPTFTRIHGYWAGDLEESSDPLQATLPKPKEPKAAKSAKAAEEPEEPETGEDATEDSDSDE